MSIPRQKSGIAIEPFEQVRTTGAVRAADGCKTTAGAAGSAVAAVIGFLDGAFDWTGFLISMGNGIAGMNELIIVTLLAGDCWNSYAGWRYRPDHKKLDKECQKQEGSLCHPFNPLRFSPRQVRIRLETVQGKIISGPCRMPGRHVSSAGTRCRCRRCPLWPLRGLSVRVTG